jgi:hypothetical protein
VDTQEPLDADDVVESAAPRRRRRWCRDARKLAPCTLASQRRHRNAESAAQCTAAAPPQRSHRVFVFPAAAAAAASTPISFLPSLVKLWSLGAGSGHARGWAIKKTRTSLLSLDASEKPGRQEQEGVQVVRGALEAEQILGRFPARSRGQYLLC